LADAGVEVPKRELRKGIVGIDRRRSVLLGGESVRCASGCRRAVALVKTAKVRTMLENAGTRIKAEILILCDGTVVKVAQEDQAKFVETAGDSRKDWRKAAVDDDVSDDGIGGDEGSSIRLV
jgi:hypothetical protein